VPDEVVFEGLPDPVPTVEVFGAAAEVMVVRPVALDTTPMLVVMG
jgi:hypothetical protein